MVLMVVTGVVVSREVVAGIEETAGLGFCCLLLFC